jgi:hypothetical protein
VKESSKGDKSNVTLFNKLTQYCSLQNIDIEDLKFCYNIENMKESMNRILSLTDDENRICKKLKEVNPDFCRIRSKKVQDIQTVHLNERHIRGVIYI